MRKLLKKEYKTHMLAIKRTDGDVYLKVTHNILPIELSCIVHNSSNPSTICMCTHTHKNIHTCI